MHVSAIWQHQDLTVVVQTLELSHHGIVNTIILDSLDAGDNKFQGPHRAISRDVRETVGAEQVHVDWALERVAVALVPDAAMEDLRLAFDEGRGRDVAEVAVGLEEVK